MTSTCDYVFVVHVGTSDPEEKSRRAEILSTCISDWDFVCDVLYFDADTVEEDNATS